MKAVARGELGITGDYMEELDFCLDCQACESACPAGVEYGKLVEAARVRISEGGHESWTKRFLKSILLKWLFEKTERLKYLAGMIRVFQTLRLDWLLEKSKILRPFSKKLHHALFLAPKISKKPSSETLHSRHLPSHPPKYKVGFLTGCIMDVAFAETNIDTVELLLHHDCEVIIPPTQCCCGSLHAHNGDAETARQLARRNTDIFSGLGLDAIVMNSAGCGAFMKQYGEVLKSDPEFSAPAAALAQKVKDLSEFLIEIGPKIPPDVQHRYRSQRVTYHDACHLIHSQKISRQPRDLVKSVPGIQYVELPEADWCCGSAGIYNITHYDSSMELLQRKVDNIRSVSPNVIVTSNPGCLLQLQYGLARGGMNIELLHLATFLRRAYGA
jgi:glycolate oxidase iron-sulfur subunit